MDPDESARRVMYGSILGPVPSTGLTISQQERDRGDIAGYVEYVTNNYVAVRPEVSERAKEAYKWSILPSRDEELAELMQGFPKAWQEEFARFNKLVVDPVTGSSSVVRRIPGITAQPMREMDREAATETAKIVKEAREKASAKAAANKAQAKLKRYTLVQILGDHEVRAKYDFSDVFIQVLRRQAALDPGKACELAREAMGRSGYPCVVLPGGYSNSVKAARTTLLRAASGMGIAQAAVDLAVVGDLVFCEGDRVHSGRPSWTVKGPLWRSHEVVAVARLAMTQGAVTVNALLQEKMLACGIELIEQEDVIPSVTGITPCYGPLSTGETGVDGALLPEAVRVAAGRVRPVVQHGKVVGTSVQVSSTSSLVNWHVTEQVLVDGERMLSLGDVAAPTRASLQEGVGYDLWVASHEAVELREGPWMRRTAVNGEEARMVFSGLRGPEFSDTVIVLRIESGAVVTTTPSQVRPGLSGAALVALHDGALLGIFYGHTYDKCVHSTISGEATESSDLQEHRAAVAVVSAGSQADELFTSFERRGLGPSLTSIVAALTPVYDAGRHVGIALNYKERAVTTLNPGARELQTVDGQVLGFQSVGSDLYATGSFPNTGSITSIRLPDIGEQVCVVGVDKDGAYLSGVLTVSRVSSASGAFGFWLADVPSSEFAFHGGVVIAISDAALLGQFVMKEADAQLSRCVALLDTSSATASSKAVVAVQEKFPSLHVQAWDVSALEGILELDPQSLMRFSGTGRNTVRTAVMLQLMRQRDESRLQHVSNSFDDPRWLLSVAVDVGIPRILEASGVSSGKVVEVFLAVLGLAAVSETSSTFEEFVANLQLLDKISCGDSDWGESSSPVEPGVARFPAPIQQQLSAVRPVSWSGGGLRSHSAGTYGSSLSRRGSPAFG